MPGSSIEGLTLRSTLNNIGGAIQEVKERVFSSYLNSIKDPEVKKIAVQKLEKNIPLTKKILEKYNSLRWREKPDFFPFFCACKWYSRMKKTNWYLAIVDYSKPVRSRRCYLINMRTNSIEVTTTCEQWTWREGRSQPGFSNIDGSWQSSIGISQTEQENPTKNFWIRDSLIVSWREHSNSMSAQRHILVHKWNVSHWCFVFKDSYKWDQIINKLKNYGTIFSYYPDASYLRTSQYV